MPGSGGGNCTDFDLGLARALRGTERSRVADRRPDAPPSQPDVLVGTIELGRFWVTFGQDLEGRSLMLSDGAGGGMGFFGAMIGRYLVRRPRWPELR